MPPKKFCSECKEKDTIIAMLREKIESDRQCVLEARSQLDLMLIQIHEIQMIQKRIQELERINAKRDFAKSIEQAKAQISKLRPRK